MYTISRLNILMTSFYFHTTASSVDYSMIDDEGITIKPQKTVKSAPS